MKRVLIIEDNDDNLYLIRFILENNGLEVLAASTGREGFEMTFSEKPDLVLMDIQLPDINGLEVTKMIRNEASCKSIPIVAISSYAMTGDRQHALEAGCSGYVEKPIDPETIMNIIFEYL
ncbi:MAG: response regulator [Bacteroidales bacterium]|nr:response regulator [Bacteroidales bacterium]